MRVPTAEHREKRRRWKAAERARKKLQRQQDGDAALSFAARKQCGTAHCDGNGTPLRRLRCKHKICEYCIERRLRIDINLIQFCFKGCKGYLPTDVYWRIRQRVELQKYTPCLRESETAPPSAAELHSRLAAARSKRIAEGVRVSQEFRVTYTQDGSTRKRSAFHTFFARVLGFTADGHVRVKWERSEFDGDTITDPLGISPVTALRRCRNQTPGAMV